MDVIMNFWSGVVLFAESQGVTAILSIAALNMALGAALAMRDGVFSVQRLGDIFFKIAPTIVVYLAVNFWFANGEVKVLVLTGIMTTFAASVTRQLSDFFPELADVLPASLTK